jgi:antirestriction protein ArdC
MYRTSATSTKRRDIYQEVTDYVIAALEKGVVPWRKPWGDTTRPQFPKNLMTGKTYRGWNLFFLLWTMRLHDFSAPYFLTYKQAKAMGGHVRAGSKGFPIIKWVVRDKDEEDAAEGNKGKEEGKDDNIRMFPVSHTVFNVAQLENISYPTTPPVIMNLGEKITLCEEIVAGMPDAPAIKEGDDRAYYSQGIDRVVMPPFTSFNSAEEYYSTLFHELIHSTGHPKRLNRKELVEHDGFGGKNYSKEELTAEFGAAFLCSVAGIQTKTIDNSAAYIQNWLSNLRKDKTLLIGATAKAQAAADYILHLPEEFPTPQATTAEPAVLPA